MSLTRPLCATIGPFVLERIRGFDFENWMQTRAAAHGTRFFIDDALGTLALIRPNVTSLPHKFDCKFFAIGLRAAAPPHPDCQGSGCKVGYHHHPLAQEIVRQATVRGAHAPMTACSAVTFGNPYNRLRTSSND